MCLKKLSIFILFFDYCLRQCYSEGHGGKHVHIKVLIPIYKHNHHHVHTVYKHPPPPPAPIIIHQHHHHGGEKKHHWYDHKREHGYEDHHGYKDFDGHNHEDFASHDNYDHKKLHEWATHAESGLNEGEEFHPSPQFHSYTPSGTGPESYDDHGYANSQKSVKLEKFQLHEAKDSRSVDPVGQHYVTASYRVQQANADESSTKEQKAFRAPLANIDLEQTSYGADGSLSSSEEDSYGGMHYDGGKEENDGYDGSGVHYSGELEPLKQFFHNRV